MNNPYNLLEDVLVSIENGIREDTNIDLIADEFDLSSRHLQRLFKMAFNQSLGLYIRSRKLAASIDELLNTKMNVLDIALDYGFEYEQSYIRSFRREYGITPGDLRKTGKILKITPPLNLFDAQKISDGIMFGPEIVVIPQFHVIGKNYKMPFRDVFYSPQKFLGHFINNELKRIKNNINPDFILNIVRPAEEGADYCSFMPALHVKKWDFIPEGLEHYTFETSICAKFRFICQELNMHNADEMYKAIEDFMTDENQKYFLERRKINIDRFSYLTSEKDYYLWEWFAPVIKKTSLKIPQFNPSGIKKVYRQKLPALRFIGKKCIDVSGLQEPLNILYWLDTWQTNNMFYDIEKQADTDFKTFFEGADAYVSLARKKDGAIEHWLGMFVPQGTEVPQGYEAFDFPKMTIGVCRAYGKRNEIINYENECRNKLIEEGFTLKNENTDSLLFFRRFNWRQFFELDVYGKRLLDYCYIVV